MAVILGIDPGSRITGYGVIHSNGQQHRYVTCGCIRIQAEALSQRLQQVFDGIREVMHEYQPDEVAVEQVFMQQNANAALKLGQARGAAIVAAAVHMVPVAEYSARQIKQAVVGYGAASKEQVQHMIRSLLRLTRQPQADAADALAVAICHAHTRKSLASMRLAEPLT
ncbi:MAG: crossover junction endodeoxyribonuclease RuvC [Legionellales bacterium]|nr:crossover junction endodeoxyribonuclease RuvC [Legionellales bacterium]